MAFLRKPASASASAIALLLLLVPLVVFTCNLNLASASSGGVMGGSFFDSDSSSSESFSTDDSDSSKPVMQRHDHDHHHHHHHASPSPDGDELAKGSNSGGTMLFLIFVFGFFLVGFYKDTNGNKITVFKLQVAMLGGMGSTIQRDLTRIAETADTSTREGVSYLLTETIQTLDRHTGDCIAGYSSVDLKRSKEDGEKCYDQLSNEEREKFDEETLVNLNNKDKRSTRSQSFDGFSNEYTMLDVKESTKEREKFEKEKLLSGFDNEYIVITVLVAAKGAHKLPNINGAEDLKKALQKLRSLLPSKLLAGEVLWTPQKEGDTLSEQKLLKDYPQLAKGMNSFLGKKQE